LHKNLVETVSELPLSAGQLQPVATDHAPTALAPEQTVALASEDMPTIEVDAPVPADESDAETMAPEDGDAAGEADVRSGRRSHGSALPR
jgi:hypothetical protein